MQNLHAIEERSQCTRLWIIPGKQAQEKRPLLNIGDSFRKAIIVGGNVRVSHDENGITTMGLKQFLLDRDSLNR